MLDACGALPVASIMRKVKEPSVPVPARFSSPLLVLGYFRSTALGAPVPENVIFMGVCCA